MDQETDSMKIAAIPTRRGLLKVPALALCAVAAGGIYDRALAQGSGTPLRLTIAGYGFDRVAALIDGRVKIEGCEITFERDGIGNANTHVLSGPQTRRVSEKGRLDHLRFGSARRHNPDRCVRRVNCRTYASGVYSYRLDRTEWNSRGEAWP